MSQNDNKIMPLQAISYVRFSSDLQFGGNTLKRQGDKVTNWLKEHPAYTLVNQYSDDGVSAYKGDHLKDSGALYRLISDAEKGLYKKGTVLLVEALDRLSRQGNRATQKLVDRILSTGLSMVLLQDNPDKIYTEADLEDELTTITIAIKAGMAKDESEKKSIRHLDNWERKRVKAKSGVVMTRMCPAWLSVKPDRSGFDAVETHWQTVKRIFKLRIEGLSMAMIAKELNSDDTPNFKGGSGKWNQSTVQQLLTNPAVYGLKIPSKQATEAVKATSEGIEGYYTVNGEKPVTMADFQLVQKMSYGFNAGKKPANKLPNMINIFKGILVCKHCGATMIMNSVNAEKMGYYVCSMRRQGRCEDSRPIRRDMVDSAIVQGLIYNVDRLLSGSDNQKEELRQMEAERESINSKRNMLTDLLLDMRIERDVYNQRYDQLGSQLAMLDHQIAVAKAKMNSEQVGKRVINLDLTKAPERVELQTIVRSLFNRISVTGGTGDARKVKDTGRKVADIEMTAGYTLINYPLDYLIDGANWIEFMQITDLKEYTFDGTENGQPIHVQLKNAPKWVKEVMEEASKTESVRTS